MRNSKVKIYNPNGQGWQGTKVEINDKSMNGVISVNFRVALGESPIFKIETFGMPDIEMEGEVVFQFTPETVQEAASVICHEAKTNETFMQAFISSIKSVLDEWSALDIGQCTDEVAKAVAGRVLDTDGKISKSAEAYASEGE